MRKYIRTKDAVYDVIKNELGECIKIDGGYIMLDNIYDYVIDRADTIEELIDQFVFICEDFNKPQLVIPMNFEYCKKEFKHTKVYGAVWCEWGLKYVAKLDNKGELQLL